MLKAAISLSAQIPLSIVYTYANCLNHPLCQGCEMERKVWRLFSPYVEKKSAAGSKESGSRKSIWSYVTR